jgi:hypothetical protein
MLALLQCPTETTKIEPVLITKEKCRQLRVLDVLAALLVREHKKVEIMAEPFNGKSIQVLSVVNLNKTKSAVDDSEVVQVRPADSWHRI